MKTYINPETYVLNVLSTTSICAASPSDPTLYSPTEHGDGSNAQ